MDGWISLVLSPSELNFLYELQNATAENIVYWMTRRLAAGAAAAAGPVTNKQAARWVGASMLNSKTYSEKHNI